MTKTPSRRTRKEITGCNGSELSPSAEMISNNVDLLTEILLRLPAKSLIRFKCVSKHWLYLISDSQFATNHSCRNPRPSISGFYFYYDRCKELKPVSLQGHTANLPTLDTIKFPSYYRPRGVQHSCNGLILCPCDTRHYVVCNLTTQKYTVLPEPGPCTEPFGLVYGAYLAFDPSRSPHYKVIMARSCYRFDIYSSESATWKETRVSSPAQGGYYVGGIYWNGAIHWLGYENVFLRFDTDAEKLIGMPHPPGAGILPLSTTRYFGECRGHLLLIQSPVHYPLVYKILEIERDYSRWIVKYRVNLGPLISVFPDIKNRHGKFHVLSVVKGTNEQDFTLVLAIAGKVVSYNPKHKQLKVVRDLPPCDFDSINYSYFFERYLFIESLHPV